MLCYSQTVIERELKDCMYQSVVWQHKLLLADRHEDYGGCDLFSLLQFGLDAAAVKVLFLLARLLEVRAADAS